MPRTMLFLASTIIVSVVVFSLVWPAPNQQNTPISTGIDRTTGPLQAPPASVHAAPIDRRRISGPADDLDWLSRFESVEPVNVEPAVPVLNVVPHVSRVTGEWSFLQGPPEDNKPYRACANCAQFQ
jgi:hypothetical protein